MTARAEALDEGELQQRINELTDGQRSAAARCKHLKQLLEEAQEDNKALQAELSTLRQEARRRLNVNQGRSPQPAEARWSSTVHHAAGTDIVRRIDVIKQGWAFVDAPSAGGLPALRRAVFGEWNVFPWPEESATATVLVYRRQRHLEWNDETRRWLWFADLLGLVGSERLTTPATVEALTYALPRSRHIPQSLWADVLARARWRSLVRADSVTLLAHFGRETPDGLRRVRDEMSKLLGSSAPWGHADVFDHVRAVTVPALAYVHGPAPMSEPVSEPIKSVVANVLAEPVATTLSSQGRTVGPASAAVSFDAARLAALREDSQRAREALASLDETEEGREPNLMDTSTPGDGLLDLLRWLMTAELHHLEDLHLRAAAAGLSPATAVRHVNEWGDAKAEMTGTDLPSPLLEVDEPAGVVWVDSVSLSAMLS